MKHKWNIKLFIAASELKYYYLCQQVCSSTNTTYESECHFYREKCWCSKDDNKCTQKNAIKDTIEYFGKCQGKKIDLAFFFKLLIEFINLAIDKCSDEQKQVFPIRIKLWLDEVLLHLVN